MLWRIYRTLVLIVCCDGIDGVARLIRCRSPGSRLAWLLNDQSIKPHKLGAHFEGYRQLLRQENRRRPEGGPT